MAQKKQHKKYSFLPEVVFVDILGTKYSIKIKTEDEEPLFKSGIADGYCSGLEKEITIFDCLSCSRLKDESTIYKLERMKDSLRHEIVHAFLYESGLDTDSHPPQNAWARDEEIVDWFSKQGQKIFRAWESVNCVACVMTPDNWIKLNAQKTSSSVEV